jgi:hypothetical protein
MKKKNLKNLVLTKETISKVNRIIIYGGIGRPVDLPQPPIDTIRIPTTRIPTGEPRIPMTVKYTNCASVCFTCQ